MSNEESSMRRPILIEDPDEHEAQLRHEDEERVTQLESRWDDEDRAGLGPWRTRAHRLARRERARRRALDDQDKEAA
jgi:hypothetical protein